MSRALLGAVANGTSESVLRLHVPGPIVAFGQTDRREPGYTHAVRTARAHGFEAVQRLAGGRAAVFHTSTVAFSWAIADPAPRKRTTQRFEEIAQIIIVAIRGLGLDARIGQIPGEYCPGGWSVNIGGRTKVMGVGQRVVRGAAHVGGVVVVDRSDRPEVA